MISLISNGFKSDTKPWQGSDPASISYPGVNSCITVTCVLEGYLAGAHLARGLGQGAFDQDLTEFGAATLKLGKVRALYLVGMISSDWSGTNRTNYTGLTYAAVSGGTLLARLREVLKYYDIVNVYDASNGNKDVDIAALRAGATATFTVGGTAIPSASFTQLAGTVMPSKGCACVIL